MPAPLMMTLMYASVGRTLRSRCGTPPGGAYRGPLAPRRRTRRRFSRWVAACEGSMRGDLPDPRCYCLVAARPARYGKRFSEVRLEWLGGRRVFRGTLHVPQVR